MLHEITVTCPSCNVEFPLTETLAQPIVAAERAKIQRETQERVAALKGARTGLIPAPTGTGGPQAGARSSPG